MRGRTKSIGFGAVVVVLGLAAAGAWRYEEHVHRQPDWQIHHTAVPVAAKKVDDVRSTLRVAAGALRSGAAPASIVARGCPG